MIFQKLESSNIAAAGYDATTSTMGVLFQGGGLYFYPGVAQRAYEVNSKAVQAADEMMQQSNNLQR